MLDTSGLPLAPKLRALNPKSCVPEDSVISGFGITLNLQALSAVAAPPPPPGSHQVLLAPQQRHEKRSRLSALRLVGFSLPRGSQVPYSRM